MDNKNFKGKINENESNKESMDKPTQTILVVLIIVFIAAIVFVKLFM